MLSQCLKLNFPMFFLLSFILFSFTLLLYTHYIIFIYSIILNPLHYFILYCYTIKLLFTLLFACGIHLQFICVIYSIGFLNSNISLINVIFILFIMLLHIRRYHFIAYKVVLKGVTHGLHS